MLTDFQKEIIKKWHGYLEPYVTNPMNSKLKSVETLTSLCDCIIDVLTQRHPGHSNGEYISVALNLVYLDRERLGKAGHVLMDDARKTVDFGLGIRAFTDLCEIEIPTEIPEEERKACELLRMRFWNNYNAKKMAKQQAQQGGATAPPEPPSQETPGPAEPEPDFDPYAMFRTQEPPPQARIMGYVKPTRPGYLMPDEYPLIWYCLDRNQDICLEGDASVGKTLSIDVLCEMQEWNLIQMGHIKDAVDIFGFNNPIDHTYMPSKLVRALMGDPALLKYPGHKIVVCFDEGFVNLSDYLAEMLPLIGSPNGYLSTDGGVFTRGDIVFVFIDNSVGDGGSTNYISRKPVDMAFKSRLFFIHMKLSPKVAKAICGANSDLYKFCEWMRKSVNRGRIDRLSLDNRGLNMIIMLDPQTDDDYEQAIYGAFLKGAPLNSLATLLRGVKANPEELMKNKYFLATQRCYEKECKKRGVKPEPTNS